MDDVNNLLILCKTNCAYSMSNIQVEFREDYNMKVHPLYSKHVHEIWHHKLKNCSNLFNATKFRLQGILLSDESFSSLPTLTFQLGITCYKDFIGTNCAPYANELYNYSMLTYQNSQSFMADPLGVGGLLITSNDDVIFMKRSDNCAEMPLMIDRPGGHPEPDVITRKTNQDIRSCDASEIRKEIFDSVLKEIRDEINIPIECLTRPLLLGIDYNPSTWRRPSLEFFVRCSLTTSKVEELYQRQTQAESEESTELIVIGLAKVLENDFKNTEIYSKLTHAAKTAIFLLKIFLTK